MTLLDHVVLQVDDLNAIGDGTTRSSAWPEARGSSIRRP